MQRNAESQFHEIYLEMPHERQKLQDGQFGNKFRRYSNYNQQSITFAASE